MTPGRHPVVNVNEARELRSVFEGTAPGIQHEDRPPPRAGAGGFVCTRTLIRVGERMVDGRGRIIEVIVRDLCDGAGPQPWYRVSWHHRMLLGRGYYRAHELDAVLALVDVGTLVAVVKLRP